MSENVLLILASVLIIEGIMPALFPNRWRAYVLKLAEQPISAIRTIGTVTLLLGVITLWFTI